MMAEGSGLRKTRFLGGKLSTFLLLIVILFCHNMAGYLLMAQSVEQVQPTYVHTALYGVVGVETGDLYAAGVNTTLLRSTDQGVSWAPVPLGDHRMHFSKLVSNGTDLFLLAVSAISERDTNLWPDGYGWSLFRFDTQTQSLSHVPVPLLEREWKDLVYEFLHVDVAATQGHLYLTYSSYDGNRSRLMRSGDGGEHWVDVSIPDTSGDKRYHLFTRQGNDDLVVYRRYHPNKKFYLSTDRGAHWESRSNPAIHLSSIAYLGEGRILAQSSEAGNILVSDTSGIWKNQGFTPFGKLSSVAVMNSGMLFVCSTDGGVFRSDDGGVSWLLLKAELNSRRSDYYQFECAAFGENKFVAVNVQGNIIVTTDGGVTWDEPRYRPEVFSHVRMSDAQHGYVYLRNMDEGYSFLMLTRDGFETLEPFPSYPLSEPDLQSGAIWYSIGYHGLYSDSLICVSRDGGAHWELVFQQEGMTAYASEIDVADTNSYAIVTSEGLYVTEDQGRTWPLMFGTMWSKKESPKRVVIPKAGPVWLLTGGGSLPYTSFSLLRSDSSRRSWDTVYVIPDSLRYDASDRIGKTWGFEDLCVLPDGSVYAVYFRDVPEIKRDELHVLYSNDLGATWQHWVTKTPVSDYLTIGNAMGPDAALLGNGGMLTDVHGKRQNLIIPMQLLSSTDGMVTAEVILDHALTMNVDNTSFIEKADEKTAYYVTGSAIYRIFFPEVMGVHAAKPPPLPLSIAAPYPQPLSNDAETATLFIQSKKITQVNMTAHDLAGRELKVLYSGELGPEGHYVTWNTGLLAPGTYLLKLTSNEGVCIRKVIVQ